MFDPDQIGLAGWVVAACTIIVIGLIVAAVDRLAAGQQTDRPWLGEPSQGGDGVSRATPLAPVKVAAGRRR